LAAKEHNKCNDNINEAALTMTEMMAMATTMAATHGDGNHVDDKKINNAGIDGDNNNGEEDSGQQQSQ
jgi:hypothetical protein